MTDRTHRKKITLYRSCSCPTDATDDVVEIGEKPVRFRGEVVTARHMRCEKDGTEFYCFEGETEDEEDEAGDCACPGCGATPGDGLVETARESRPGGDIVTYECEDCGDEVQCLAPPEEGVCACPECDSSDPDEREEIGREPMADGASYLVEYRCLVDDTEYECIEEEPGDCRCPTRDGPLDETAEEVSRELVQDGPEGEIWRVRYRCVHDGTEFDCLENSAQECKCPNCASMDGEELSRSGGADGSVVVHYRCNDCGHEYDCAEGEGSPADCVCPDCGGSPSGSADDFEVVDETETADGKRMIRYRCKKDGSEFECLVAPGDGEICKCPKCGNLSDFEVLERNETSDGQVNVKLKCNNCGYEIIECKEEPGESCICEVCGDSDSLEEVSREDYPGGALVVYRCKKHPDELVECVDLDGGAGEDADCSCPRCGATPDAGLVELGRDQIELPDGSMATVKHMKCEACGFVRGECSTDRFAGEEATECIITMPPSPACPECGSENIRQIGRRTIGDKTVVTYRCDDCGEEFEVELVEEEDEDKPTCPDCGSDLSELDVTEVSEGVSVAHMKCPRGHTHPEDCSEAFDDCVLDIPVVEDEPEDCQCPCPGCGGCNYVSKGVCRRDDQCVMRVVCVLCKNEYFCPVDGGVICPYCCSTRHLKQIIVVDSGGDPVIEDGNYKAIVYCSRCKKGRPDTWVRESDIGECD